MIILSIDYGEARTGVAICDRDEMLARPLCVLRERSMEKLVEKIAARAADEGAQMIVVGLPRNMDGSLGPKAQICAELAARLESATGLKTEMYDERLTTVMAHRALNEVNVRGKKRKNTVDAVAAVMILEDFLRLRSSERG